MYIYVFILYLNYYALSNTICYNDIACDVAYGDANDVAAYGDNMMLLLMMITTILIMMLVMVVMIVI